MICVVQLHCSIEDRIGVMYDAVVITVNYKRNQFFLQIKFKTILDGKKSFILKNFIKFKIYTDNQLRVTFFLVI